MELRHLRSFLVLAEELHQGRAAARLGIEQPSLSRQIKELEEELRVQLFHRTSRSTWLSSAGEALLPDARRILADTEMTRDMVAAGWMGSKRLRLGFAEGFVGAPIGALLRHLEAPAHDVRTLLVERPLSDLVGMLASGAIDAVFAPEQATTVDTVSVPAWSEPLVLMTPAGSRGGSVLSLAELALPLFMPDPMFLPGFAAQLDELLPQALPRARSRFASVATLYSLVGTGHGAGLLPVSMAMSSDRVRVRGVRTKKARITFWMTVRRDDDTPAVTILREAVAAGVIRASPPRADRNAD